MSPARTDGRVRPAAARVLGIGLCLAVLAASAAGLRARADDAKPAGQDDDKLKTLLRTRLEVAQSLFDLRMQELKAGKIAADELAKAGKQLLVAQLDLAESKDDRISVCQKNLARWNEAKRIADAKLAAGVMTQADAKQFEWERLDAEILLEREKAK